MATLITDVKESFLNNIQQNDYRATKLYLESGLIDDQTKKEGLEAAIRNYVDEIFIKLFLEHDTVIPNDPFLIFLLPNELFLEYIDKIDWDVTDDIICKCIMKYDKVKWDMIRTKVDLSSLQEYSMFVYIKVAYQNDNYDLFCEMVDEVKDNKRLLFIIFIMSAYKGRTDDRYFNYVANNTDWDDNQIILLQMYPLVWLQSKIQKLYADRNNIGLIVAKIRESNILLINEVNTLANFIQYHYRYEHLEMIDKLLVFIDDYCQNN